MFSHFLESKAHHSQLFIGKTNAPNVSSSFSFTPIYCSIWHETPFGQCGSAILVLSPLSSLCTHSPSLAGLHEKQNSPGLSVSAALQQLKHGYGVTTV